MRSITSPTVVAFGRGDVFALHETAGRLFVERERFFDGEAGVFVGGGEDAAELLFVDVGGDGGGVVGVEFAERAADVIRSAVRGRISSRRSQESSARNSGGRCRPIILAMVRAVSSGTCSITSAMSAGSRFAS